MVARLFPDVDISKFLRPDYSQAQEDLWVQVAMLASQHSLSLDFLIKPHKDPNIPTWVTNYQTRGCDSLALSFPKFNAGLCSSSTWPKHTTTTTTLTCYGAKFDVIQSTLTLDMEGVDNFDFIRILNFLLSMKEDVDTRLDTLWRTMIWNCADAATKIPGNRVIAPASFQENFVAYMIGQTAIRWAQCQSDEDKVTYGTTLNNLYTHGTAAEKDLVRKIIVVYAAHLTTTREELDTLSASARTELLYPDRNKASEFDDKFTTHSLHKGLNNLFKTERGFVGLGSNLIQEGDQIWLLVDGHTPFVLRAAKEDTFTLAGDCYIHGLMFREMLEGGWGVRERVGPINII